jgi:hypothetical protein
MGQVLAELSDSSIISTLQCKRYVWDSSPEETRIPQSEFELFTRPQIGVEFDC